MEVISVILVMLMAVVASGVLVRISPVPLPLPFVQIALGALIAYATGFRVQLDPGVFFLLFLPPLLFLDGWRIPKHGLFRDGWTILELALGLVVFTVVGLGFFIHWMVPAMPLGVAFALAAVLSPTDPIAVSAITARAPMPKRLMHILEGESLLNDASGLVCLRLAVAAILTGSFSLGEASLTFLQLAVGGIGIGIAVTWAIARAKNIVSKRFGEESGSQILISLLIPFAAYLLAESFHCSGILAAVAAGVTMSYVEISGQVMAVTRVRRNAVWDTVQFALNGTIFVLLGEQLPRIIEGAANNVGAAGQDQLWVLALYVGAITLALAVLRFVWVWTSLRFTLFRTDRRAERGVAPNWRLVAAASLAGVRGAITLAGVLTLPLFLPDGSPFPTRDLAILLAAGVIILSLIVASAFLPLVLKSIETVPEPARLAAEDRTRISAAEAAIRAIERAQHDMAAEQADADIYADAAAHIMDIYRNRIEGRSQTGEAAEAIRRTDEIDLSDEGLCARWIENPYYQYFCGEEFFQHKLVFDRSSMTRWRQRMGEEKLAALVQESLAAAARAGAAKPADFAQIIVDTTVQPKAIAFPTDAKLAHRARERLARRAHKHGVRLRQSYKRLGKSALIKHQRYAHAKHFKRANKALRKLKTYLGRVIRDIMRKTKDDAVLREIFAKDLSLAQRVREQFRGQRGHKVYALHAPEVECIGKGKAHKPYEFGVKVSLATPIKRCKGGQFIAHIKALPGNPYDGHTLATIIPDLEKQIGVTLERIIADAGYRGHNAPPTHALKVYTSGQKRRMTPAIKRLMRRRPAVEPVIGHTKNEHRMDRNHLAGSDGDAANAVLAGAGYNFSLLLNWLRDFLRQILAALRAPAESHFTHARA